MIGFFWTEPWGVESMSLSKADVESIAHLARLAVTEEQMSEVVGNLSRIIDFVAQLQAVDTSGVEPMAHPLAMVQRLREDEVQEADQRDLYQANAPTVEAGLYLVPKVIE
jgi:aspartyl-tRNA(Asn)/glutamyl-tRNA(Gln) amidotransferase subunit C